jgi:hypothetical protein
MTFGVALHHLGASDAEVTFRTIFHGIVGPPLYPI